MEATVGLTRSETKT